MIKLNLPVLFAQRGIRVADADRMSNLGRATLYRLYNNDVTRIEFDTIDKLCDLLNCAPGDLFVKEISCASIIAKVSHTNYINELCASNEKYKLYSLESNQGYGTKKHLEALEKHGYIEGFHRKSYKPVKNTFENKNWNTKNSMDT